LAGFAEARRVERTTLRMWRRSIPSYALSADTSQRQGGESAVRRKGFFCGERGLAFGVNAAAVDASHSIRLRRLRRLRCSAGSSARSASSKAANTRRLLRTASSMRWRPVQSTPILVSEVAWRRSGGDDQEVVAEGHSAA
jgi:hypothetical protein